MTRTRKCQLYVDPYLARQSTSVRFRGIISTLETRVAELEAMEPQTITVEVPVEKIVTETVTVEVPVEVEKIVEVPVEVEKIVERIVEVEVDREDIAFNRAYIQILRDHIADLNQFAIDTLSEDASSP